MNWGEAMALLKPDEEDLRKLHAEVNQIGNQRFIVTTLALTFFAADAAGRAYRFKSA
jgi:hypothetical protein